MRHQRLGVRIVADADAIIRTRDEVRQQHNVFEAQIPVDIRARDLQDFRIRERPENFVDDIRREDHLELARRNR